MQIGHKRVRSSNTLPELVGRRIVLETCGSKTADEVVLIDVLVIAQGVQRRIFVAEFRIDDTEEHHRVVGQFHIDVRLRIDDLTIHIGWHYMR